MLQFNRNRFALITIAIILALTSLSPLFSEGNQHNEKPIIFLGNKDLAPILYSANGKAQGVVADIAREIGTMLNRETIIKAINWDEAQKKVLSGEADALLQMNINFERTSLYDFSQPLLESEFSIFYRSDNSQITDILSLQGKKVGVEKGGYPEIFLKTLNNIELVDVPDWNKAFEKVVSGEIDAVVMDRWIGEYQLAQQKNNTINIIDTPIEKQYSRIAVKKGNTELLREINSALDELYKSGVIDEILNSYRGERVIYMTEKSLRNSLLSIAVVLLLTVSIISLIFTNKYRKLSRSLESEVEQRTKSLYETNKLLREANSELAKISVKDELTNITNRRGFESFFEKSWFKSMKKKQFLSIIMLDIDFFKQYNDTYGHLSGDRCLIHVARQIQIHLKREGDIVARFGGEEFIIMLHNTSEEKAALLADQIRNDIELLRIKNEQMNSFITVSCGVTSVIPNQHLSMKDIINNADKALYHAKNSGRNKTVTFSSLPS